MITCEDGGNRIPEPYRDLFRRDRALLHSHRGFDAGSLIMAQALASAFDALLAVAMVSRLLVDLNRSVGHPRLHCEASRKLPAPLRARIVAPKELLRLSANAVANDTGQPDVVVPGARQAPVQELPDETLQFLLGSRYCETDRLSETAWQLFENTPAGWGRVQAICDFVHRHIVFGYEHARSAKIAFEVYQERLGGCRAGVSEAIRRPIGRCRAGGLCRRGGCRALPADGRAPFGVFDSRLPATE